MPIIQIDSNFSVSKQIELTELEDVKAAGFKTVISNRPDGEEADQPAAAIVGTSVDSAGLTFTHQPVVSGKITDEDVAAFGQFLAAAEKPVFAFCRTGTRCTHLWAMATVTVDNLEEVVAKAQAAGYDLTALRPRLEALAARRA